MRLSRALTLLAAGAAAAWLVERRGRTAAVALPGAAPGPRPLSPEPSPRASVRGPQVAVHSPQSTGRGSEDSGFAPAEPPPSAPPAPKLPAFDPPDPDVEAPDPRILAAEQPTLEHEAVEQVEPVDVQAVVDDLLAPADGESIVDAEVVEDHGAEPLTDERLATRVRRELAKDPGIPAGAVVVEVDDGLVYLRGQIDSPGLIGDLERRVQELDGVGRVRNLLHLPGTPPPG
jgi:hypothetical protein